MSTNRRHFLTAAASCAITDSILRGTAVADDETDSAVNQSGARHSNPIALSTYSLWRFHNQHLRDIHRCIDIAADMGFDGVELLLYQIQQNELLSNASLQSIKRHSVRLGLPLCGMSTHQ